MHASKSSPSLSGAASESGQAAQSLPPLPLSSGLQSVSGGAAADEGGTSGPLRRSCEACRTRKIKCSREAVCSNCRLRNQACVYADDPSSSPSTENLNLQAQMNQMRADIARLQDEVAVLRRRDSTSQQTERDQGLAMPSPQVAGPSANRLPIPSLPIGANHYQQQQVQAGAISPLRGRTMTAPYVAYTAPATAWPANHSSAMALLPGANHNHLSPQPAASAAVPPQYAAYPAMPSYYVPPRANHLGSSYPVGTGSSYMAIPVQQDSLADLDPPGQPAIGPSARSILSETSTRPTITYPISHERPTASAIPIVPTSSAMALVAAFPLGSPSLSATSALPTSLLPPHLDVATAAPMLAPPAPSATATLAPASGVAGLQLSPPSRYHVLLGAPSGSGYPATLPPTQPMPTGVLWSAPRPTSAGAGIILLGNGVQQSLGPAPSITPHGGGVQLYQQPAPPQSSLIGHGNGLTLFSGGGGGAPNDSQRSSLDQQPVTDWQALLEDSTRFTPSATPVSLGDATPSVPSLSHARTPID